MRVSPVIAGAAIALTAACSSSSAPPASSPSSPPATPAPVAGAALTPTPTNLQRQNPDVVEDTATYTVERYKKTDYIKVDATHIRHPMIARPVAFFKEDDQYYYVYNPKVPSTEELAQAPAGASPSPTPVPTPSKSLADYGMPAEDFDDITPPRIPAAFRLEAITPTGLPTRGMWRHSFLVADMNGDGKPDIVAPPARLGGDARLNVWLNDGHGKFSRQQLTYFENGKPKPNFSADYGGVAVGDIDGDGKLDVVIASHSAGLIALFGEGDGKYAVSRQGLPARDFSTQAVVLVDVNGDGKLDIVASSDTYEIGTAAWDPHQIRVYLSDGARGFRYAPDALVDGAWSNTLAVFDYDGDGRPDVVTGSQAYGAVQLLWRNTGTGKFTTGYFPQIEIHGFHFAAAPGTFGRDRRPAYADAFTRATNKPVRLDAQGVTVYSYAGGAWDRHRIWRKKDGKSFLYALAMGDIDGDGLDDVVFADSSGPYRLRIFLQRADGTFAEAAESAEPILDSPGQCVRLADVDGDGRLDVIVSKTYTSARSGDPGGWSVFLNRPVNP